MASGPRITIGSAVDNEALTATNSTTFTYSWITGSASAGSYTVTVTGTDLAGNTYAGSDSIDITLDNTPPTVTLSDTDDDNFLAASDTVTITADFDEAMTSTPTISISGTSISNQVMIKLIGGTGKGSFNLLGQDIDGAQSDNNGISVSFSSDGSRVAIGANQTSLKKGYVRIFDYNESAWVQVGGVIYGEAVGDLSGTSVSLSSDGSRVAIGAVNNDNAYTGGNNDNRGHVRIYDYNSSTQSWVQVGADIEGEARIDYSGKSVSLSSDGSRLAIGAEYNDGSGDLSGHVRIYNYTPSGTTSWTQLGQDIDGELAGDASGRSVSLSSDGSRVAIGANQNDGTAVDRYGNRDDLDLRGHVRIYDYNSSTQSWVQVGADIDGEAAGDRSGYSVSLSSDGSIVAIGAPNNDGTAVDRYDNRDNLGHNYDNRGHVRIYNYTPSGTTSWTQLGQDIDGETGRSPGFTGDGSGYWVSLSSDGLRVAIGAPYNRNENGVNSGHVRIYDYNGSTWVKVGADIDGEVAADSFGQNVSLSSDGSKIAIGAPGHDANGSGSGRVGVYSISSGETYQYAWDVDSGGAPSDGTYTVTVTGADKAGNAYSGTDSITFTLDTTAPTVTLT
jgi:hypothetical protein